MMKPCPLKWQSPPRDPNPGEAKPRIKIARPGLGSYIEADLKAALGSINTELEVTIEAGELEDELVLSIVMMSDAAVEALPEFEGW
ncbi:MAG: hypothetical protein O7A04_06755 [Acidobacteria bacterium]|nr:hypothetical protein [Acidobacteriota bacterium]